MIGDCLLSIELGISPAGECLHLEPAHLIDSSYLELIAKAKFGSGDHECDFQKI